MSYQFLTTEEMKAFEKYTCDNFDITFEDMMQNAGKTVFDFIINELKPNNVLVVVGKGNNGGDALVSADLLKKEGIDVTVLNIGDDLPKISDFDLIVDAIFGFSLKGSPRSPIDGVINWINESDIPVLSVDIPSGIEAFTGQIMKPTVRASYTITLGMPKIGLDSHKEYVGKLFLGNLGISAKAYEEKGYNVPNFNESSYISLD